MGMLTGILGKQEVKKRSWAELHSFFDTMTGYSTDEKNTITQQLAEYRSWVMVVTNVIYRRFSEIDYKFYRNDTDEEIKKRNPAYKAISKIFRDPNDFMEFRYLKQVTQLSLDLTGYAFIYREDDPVFGLPLKLWPLNVSDFRGLVLGKTFRDWIIGFKFLIGGDEVILSPSNVLYFHYPHPKDARLGSSPIQQQAYAIDVDHYIEVYESSFFQNSARPDIALSYPENVQLEEEDAKKIIADWKKKFRGEEKYHEIALLDQGAKIEKLTTQNQDLALAWLSGWSMDKILSAFCVPKGKVGIMVDINKSSSQSIEETFNRESILPRLRLFDEVVTRSVLQRFDERLEMRHNNPVPKDQEILIKEATEKTGVPTRTINEQREIDGQRPVPGGDSVHIPLNFVALGSNRPPPERSEPEETEGELSEEEEGTDAEPEKIFVQRETYSEEWLDKKWYVFKAYTEGWESVWMSQLARLFGDQQEEVIRNLEAYWDRAKGVFDEYERIKQALKTKLPAFMEKHRDKSTEDIVRYFEQNQEEVEKVVGARESGVAKIIMEALIKKDDEVLFQLADHIKTKQSEAVDYILFDWDENMRAFSKTGTQITGTIIQETANEELTSLGLEASFGLENPMAREYLGSKVREFSEAVLSTKADQLRSTLIAGFAAGEGIRKMTQRVQGVYASVLNRRYEALRIARTETIAASNAGAMMGYEASGVVKEKGWLSTRDQRTRGADPKDAADHWNMDGDRVRLNEAFVDTRTGASMMHPGDTGLGAGSIDVVLCRCTMVPYTTSTTKVKDATVNGFLEQRDLSAVGTARGRRAIKGCYA